MFALYLILIVVLMVAMSVVMTKLLVKVMGKLGGEAIYKLFQSAEFIHNTGAVPPLWREKEEKNLNLAREAGGQEEKIQRLENRARRRYLKQLIKTIQFAERSSTVADEETRGILVASLWKTYEKWREMSLKEMTGV